MTNLMGPEELLFNDKDGVRTSLQDVIYDGLDRDYSDRYIALLQLTREGEVAHRLYACAMLTSWGVREGLYTLIEWATHPDSTPWAGAPVTYDRFYGADAAFEMLADAVRVAHDVEQGRPEVAALRVEAARALLGIYHRVHFSRSMLMLFDEDTRLAEQLRPEIATAVDRAVEASGSISDFDMGSQAAFLLGILASFDDDHAARSASALLDAHPGNSRIEREMAYALGWGTGPGTMEVLQQLELSPFASVRQDVKESVERRAKAVAEGTDEQ